MICPHCLKQVETPEEKIARLEKELAEARRTPWIGIPYTPPQPNPWSDWSPWSQPTVTYAIGVHCNGPH